MRQQRRQHQEFLSRIRGFKEKIAAKDDQQAIDKRISKIEEDFARLKDDPLIEEDIEQLRRSKRKTIATGRSGPRELGCNVDGKIINRGIKDGKEELHQKDIDYLRRRVIKTKAVRDLSNDEIRFLLTVEFRPYLQDIKRGKIPSEVADKYDESLKTGNSTAVFVMCPTSTLFTNQQVDYINGCMMGAYHLKSVTAHGVNHDDMDKVGIVLTKVALASIVRFVHKLDTIEQAIEFMNSHASLEVNED